MSRPWEKLWGRELLSDSTIMRWPVGARWCYVGSHTLAGQSPDPGYLLDESGAALQPYDLARLLHVHRDTVDRFLDLAIGAGRVERDASGLLYVRSYLRKQQHAAAHGRSAPDDKHAGVDDLGEELGKRLDVVVERTLDARQAHAQRALSGTEHSPIRAGGKAEAEAEELNRATASAVANATLVDRALAELRDGNDTTRVMMLSLLARGVPEVAFAIALERVRERRADPTKRRLASEARYFVSTARQVAEERQ